MEAKEIEKGLKIKNYFLNMNRNDQEKEVLEIIDFFDKNSFSVFPYDFSTKYHSAGIKVYQDEKSVVNYVLHNDKRLYFPETCDMDTARNYYNLLCIEQDVDSPHRYETLEYSVKNGDIIADIGAAEGIWALTNVEKAKKIYLFECNPSWVKALEKTFEPWKEKTFIINKYISNYSDGANITLDDFLKGREINFIKADIEGAELNLLKGAKKTLNNAVDLKLLLCAYHQKDDAENLRLYLEAKDFFCEYSKGYMLFVFDEELDEPYLRRGLIRATKMHSCFTNRTKKYFCCQIERLSKYFR